MLNNIFAHLARISHNIVRGPQTSEKTSSEGWLDALVDFGYGSLWHFAYWQASHTQSFSSWTRQGKLDSLRTLWTMEVAKCPRQPCHVSIDGFMTPHANLLTPIANFLNV
jgi:hypothetical protein